MNTRNIYEKLNLLSKNLWWAWQPHVLSIFKDLNPSLFQELNHNPVELLAHLPSEVIESRTIDTEFHARVDRALRQLEHYLNLGSTWIDTHAGPLRTRRVAYFSAEFGIHESLPIYSGGLGMLAGDHLKSASDLGLPIVGISLFYREGYFRQRLDHTGWQQVLYKENNPNSLPMRPALDESGEQVKVAIPTPTGTLYGKVWQVDVGRATLLLLDSDVPDNNEEDQKLTHRLYGGDIYTRIRQELLLGVGGVQALNLMGINAGVYHLNEGHSAFAVLEATRIIMKQDGLSFDEASNIVKSKTVFTTHTPVEAGHDRFSPGLLEKTLGYLREGLRLNEHEIMSLGRVNPNDHSEYFNMTVLALKMSNFANGVSSLHGRISRQMWNRLWPDLPSNKVPIGHVTNGVHVLSWLAPEMHALYDHHFTPHWPTHQSNPKVWKGIDLVENAELWETHRLLKVRLVAFVREYLAKQRKRRGAPNELISQSYTLLDPEVLTIGFARRFATYKRADLLFSDLDRLAKLVSDKQFPVQFVFAGKAHPNDDGGKALIQKIVQIASEEPFKGRVVFLEDHDMNIGRHLVQGVDVWLNNPRKPMEASGTSGQKVLLNGVLNLSVLDGWWPEAYDGLNGFAIGDGHTHKINERQDERDQASLYNILEDVIVPLYYQRDSQGVPHQWVERMKRAIRTLGWKFNTDRMVMDYIKLAYLPSADGSLNRTT